VLTLFRRHLKACPQTSRRYRRCQCPIHVEGSLQGEKIRKALDLTSWEAAADLVAAWNASGKIGVVRPEVPTVKEAVDKFLADATSRHLQESSLKKYRVLLSKRLVTYAQDQGRTRLTQLNVEALRQFRESWGFSPIAHEKNLGYLKAFFRFCETAGWIDENTAAALKAPKVKPNPTLPFTSGDWKKLVGACDKYNGDGDRIRALIWLLRYSGLRIGDAVALKRDRVSGPNLLLYTQKSGTPVRVPLPRFVVSALTSRPGSEYFFWSGHGKIKSALEDIRKSFMRVAAIAKVDHAHFHRFRDLFAVSLLERGVPIEDVAILLGHQNSRVTARHYNPWVRSRQRQLESVVKKTWKE
jgi:integrase/recombinase XerD